jgi:hypothetical protein
LDKIAVELRVDLSAECGEVCAAHLDAWFIKECDGRVRRDDVRDALEFGSF